MLPAILICAFMVKNVATQRTANATLGTTKSCVLIGDDVKLLCTVSADCCSSFARVWEKGSAIILLDDGKSTLDPLKYVEDFDGGTTGFNLIIKNVQKSDFGVNYKCLYGATESAQFYLDDISCPSSEVNISGDCWECVAIDYGWSILGDVIGTVIIMIIATGLKVKCDLKSFLRGGLLFIISAVFNAIVSLLIGIYVCHCVNGTDPWLILLGLGTSLIIGVLSLTYKKNKGDDVDFRVECCFQALAALFIGCMQVLVTLCTVPTVKVRRSSYVVTPGETMTLVCTVTSCLTISSVQWERNVGGSTTTIDSNTNPNKYSGSTATTPSLTILKAASSDEGTYRCFASNCAGKGHSTTITVGDESTDEDN